MAVLVIPAVAIESGIIVVGDKPSLVLMDSDNDSELGALPSVSAYVSVVRAKVSKVSWALGISSNLSSTTLYSKSAIGLTGIPVLSNLPTWLAVLGRG